MSFALPRTLTSPSGARLTLRRASSGPIAARRPDDGPLFAEVLALFERDVSLLRGGERVDVLDLPLCDFHVVRAVLTKAGLVHEDEVEIDCHNCGARLTTRPCEGLETGPWEDGEADDPELDRTAELGAPLEVRPLRVGRVRQARTVTLAARTVREALPLFEALGRDPWAIDAGVVEAMGIVALGAVDDPALIARALATCDAAALGSVTDAFLEAHYPLRLARDVFCPTCRARNVVDAPAEREFELSPVDVPSAPDDERRALAPLDDFVERAHAIAEPLIAALPGEPAELVVEAGTPAVDDGGEPLLGSYVPPPPEDSPVPARPGTVTVYYQTFERIEREEGRFDWEAELRETIEHELEHHVYFLQGHDPMDEEERAVIDQEVVRVVGRGEATRRALAGFGGSLPDFVRRAWPLIALGALALAIALAEGRCAPGLDPVE